jgi:hypothetical protein
MPGTVPTTIGSTIIQPAVSLLRPVLDENGPFGFGSHTITDFLTTTAHGLLPAGTWPVGGTYGVIVQPSGSIPVAWGYELGYDSGGSIGAEGWVYENRFAQLIVMHQAIGGSYVTMSVTDCHSLQTYIPMDLVIGGGDRIGLYPSAGVSVDLYFMCLLA